MEEDTKIIIEFNKRLHRIVDQQLQTEIQDTDNKAFFEAFVLAKAFKTHEAIMLLAEYGYGEDAFTLARSLFELMITNAYILQDPTEDMLMRYMNYDWVTRKEMYEYISANPDLLKQLELDLRMEKEINTVDEVNEQYAAAMQKYKYRRGGWSDKSIKQMAESVGRSDMYSTVYRLQCTVGHTNSRSMNEYVRVTEGGTEMNVGANWDLTRTTLVVSFDCFFHILEKAAQQFGWSLDESLKVLEREYTETLGTLKHGTS